MNDMNDKQSPADRLMELVRRSPGNRFGYRMLSRLRMDCNYFLGTGNGAEKHLWTGSVPEQIKAMRALWKHLPEKPEWLTEEQIGDYGRRMTEMLERQRQS